MTEGNVNYKLDLVVNLLDTTTGYPIQQKEVMFHSSGQIVAMNKRGDGTYILMNHGREDMDLEVSVKGYLPKTVPIRYEELSQQYPTVEVPLVPVVLPYGYHDFCTVEGEMEGITDIAAISVTKMDASLGAYNMKKGTIRLFASRRLDETRYAVYHKEEEEFEEFCIVKKSEQGFLLQLKDPLQKECRPEEGIARIVHGITDVNGRYLLRVRMDGKGKGYLVRYTVNGLTKFKRIEFGDERERRLDSWD